MTTLDLAGLCERLRAISTTDHLRGCEGRNYHCTCLWDEMNMATGPEAAAAIESLVAENERMREALTKIAGIEPKPFEGGLDMEAIRACDECKRYEGHPIQHGICDTHRRPIWDREKHESHEEKALGYRAKTIARTALEGASDDR